MRLSLAAALAAALVCAAPAAADTTTILKPPDRSPVVIAGSGVQRGERLADGQVLVRRLTTVRSGERRVITLTCPEGFVHGGLGLFDDARIGFASDRYPGHVVARLEVFATGRVARGQEARGSIFALCVTPAR
jgi:hypothetical protein